MFRTVDWPWVYLVWRSPASLLLVLNIFFPVQKSLKIRKHRLKVTMTNKLHKDQADGK